MNKNYKKYIKHIFLPTLMLISLLSCKKFLDTPQQGQYNKDNYPFPQGGGIYDTYIFGAYNDLRSFSVHVDGFISATSIRSDDADKGSTASDGGADAIGMDNFPVLTNSGRANALWTGYFGLITKCNLAINQIDSVLIQSNVSEELKLQSKAEVRFLRGYAYFNLVRLFGRIPKVDAYLKDPQAQNNIPQSTPQEIYTLIEEDLKFAATYLPTVWDTKFIGRVTKGAANGLLAKVYLTQNKWQMAFASAQEVISSNLYDLSVDYSKIFSEEGENSKESIFEVQATASPSIQQTNGIQYASVQGVRGTGNWNIGWGFNTPSENLAAAYETNDPRKARTILFASTTTTTNNTIFGEVMPIFPTDVPNPMYNHKVLGSPTLRNTINRGGWWMNVRILRYADVILIAAESANELGRTEEARTLLNSIRQRARRGAAAGILPDITVTDQNTLRERIRHERRIELAMEHDRFFDLVRWGISQTVLNAAGKTNFIASRDNLLPIPQQQIDLTKGILTQNPGYAN